MLRIVYEFDIEECDILLTFLFLHETLILLKNQYFKLPTKSACNPSTKTKRICHKNNQICYNLPVYKNVLGTCFWENMLERNSFWTLCYQKNTLFRGSSWPLKFKESQFKFWKSKLFHRILWLKIIQKKLTVCLPGGEDRNQHLKCKIFSKYRKCLTESVTWVTTGLG